MNLTDLRDELDARSAPDDDLLGSVRLAGVQTRIQAIRRRRVAGVAAACALVAAVFIGYAVVPRDTALPEPAQSPSPSAVNGFREYGMGSKLVATQTASMRDTISLTAVAGPDGFSFAHRCTARNDRLMVRWRINGHDTGGGSCSPDSNGFYRVLQPFWDEAGVRPGEPATLVAQVEWSDQKPSSPPIPEGTFAVAVMQRLAFADYPFPPRPAELKPFSEEEGNLHPERPIAFVDSDPNDPNAVRTVTVAVPADSQVTMAAQTPGYIHLTVDGKPLGEPEWWDYELTASTVLLRSDEKGTRTVTITFRPEHMTGAWRAVIHR